MATLKTQQKEKLVEMLKKHYELDNEENILNFIENIANDCCDKKDARLELTLIAYSLMGKERIPKIDNNTKQIRIRFNPGPNKLQAIKALKETRELNLSLKEAKEAVESKQIIVAANLSEVTQGAICIAGGNIEWIEKV